MLTAIPVGQGDAFLLHRQDGPTILVDGGRSQKELPFRVSHLVKDRIDVVVCTHADADHADGLIGLLDDGSTPVKEVWLPGRWASRLEDLLRPNIDWLEELCEQVNRTEADSLEDVADGHGDESQVRDKEIHLRDIADILAETGRRSRHAFYPPLRRYRRIHGRRAPFWSPRDPKRKLFVEAVKAAARIRDVALAAHHRRAKIRWFDFEEAKTSGVPAGGEMFLRPLNSVEIKAGHALRKMDVLLYLALSVANRESLVFAAPEGEKFSGVVFAADSDLACSQHIPMFNRTAAVTAPHHGSESNAVAYQAVANRMGSSLGFWIRSDGNYKKRPGNTYLQQRAQRACTLCRDAGLPKQAVQLVEGAGGWMLGKSALCQCK
jgi:hypothetical protein